MYNPSICLFISLHQFNQGLWKRLRGHPIILIKKRGAHPANLVWHLLQFVSSAMSPVEQMCQMSWYWTGVILSELMFDMLFVPLSLFHQHSSAGVTALLGGPILLSPQCAPLTTTFAPFAETSVFLHICYRFIHHLLLLLLTPFSLNKSSCLLLAVQFLFKCFSSYCWLPSVSICFYRCLIHEILWKRRLC